MQPASLGIVHPPFLWWEALRRRLLRWQFLHIDLRRRLYQRLASNIEADIPLYDTFRVLSARYAQRGDPRAALYRDWAEHMAGGTLGDTLRGWIPSTERATIAAAERAGATRGGLIDAAHYLAQLQAIRAELRKAFSYPLLLLAVLVIYVLFWAFRIVPALNFDPELLSEQSQFTINMAEAIRNWSLPLLVPLLAGAGAVWWSCGHYTGPARRLLDRALPWSTYRQYQTANFLLSLNTLLSAELPLRDCLNQLRTGATPWLLYQIDLMSDSLVGRDPSVVLSALVDPELGDDIAVAAAVGTIENTIAIIARQIHISTTERINSLAQRINVVLLALVTAFIVLLVGSLLSIGGDLADRMDTIGAGPIKQ